MQVNDGCKEMEDNFKFLFLYNRVKKKKKNERKCTNIHAKEKRF